MPKVALKMFVFAKHTTFATFVRKFPSPLIMYYELINN